jgi:endonuclease/exonuclease/phosphatase family metal-dependent hydrolase
MLVAGCAVAPPAAVPTKPAAVLLAVVTWNMHAGRGDLPRLIEDLASGKLPGAAASNYVLLLQELVVDAAGDLPSAGVPRQLSSIFVPIRSSRGGRMSGNAILSTSPLRDTLTIPLPSERQPRSALVGTIDVSGEPLFVACVHLENRISFWRGGLFSDTARGRQAEALLRALPQGHGIAGGDFNTWLGPNEPAWQLFSGRFADSPRDPPTPTFRNRLVLDHLFFDLPAGWRATRRVVPEKYGSDHNPVVGLITRDQG